MIFIQSVNYKQVPKYNSPDFIVDHLCLKTDEVYDSIESKEICKGIRYTKPDGSEIVIAQTKEVQDLIGIQYEAWEELEKQNAYLIHMVSRLRSEIDKARSLTFWQRVKAVFTGIRITLH